MNAIEENVKSGSMKVCIGRFFVRISVKNVSVSWRASAVASSSKLNFGSGMMPGSSFVSSHWPTKLRISGSVGFFGISRAASRRSTHDSPRRLRVARSMSVASGGACVRKYESRVARSNWSRLPAASAGSIHR